MKSRTCSRTQLTTVSSYSSNQSALKSSFHCTTVSTSTISGTTHKAHGRGRQLRVLFVSPHSPALWRTGSTWSGSWILRNRSSFQLIRLRESTPIGQLHSALVGTAYLCLGKLLSLQHCLSTLSAPPKSFPAQPAKSLPQPCFCEYQQFCRVHDVQHMGYLSAAASSLFRRLHTARAALSRLLRWRLASRRALAHCVALLSSGRWSQEFQLLRSQGLAKTPLIFAVSGCSSVPQSNSDHTFQPYLLKLVPKYSQQGSPYHDSIAVF